MNLKPYPKYKDSEIEWLGEIPAGWEVKRLKFNLQLLTEKTDRRENPVALENIESWLGRYKETESEFQGEGVAFEKGDILFGKLRPYLAKAWLADFSGEAIGDFFVMRPSMDIDGRFTVYQILNNELPIDKESLPREIVESIDMDRYRIKATYKGGITLEKKEGQITPLTPEEKQPPVSEYDRLSAIIAKINEIGGTQFAEDDKVKFARLGDKIYDNDHFKESMKTNTKSNLKLLFKKLFDKAMADMYESDLSFYKKIEENPSVKELIKDNLFEDVFKRGKEINP